MDLRNRSETVVTASAAKEKHMSIIDATTEYERWVDTHIPGSVQATHRQASGDTQNRPTVDTSLTRARLGGPWHCAACAGLARHQQEKPLLLLLFGCGLFRFTGIILQHG